MKQWLKRTHLNIKADVYHRRKNKKPIIDTHCHMLTRFLKESLDDFALSAKRSNIVMINMSFGPDGARDALEVNKRYPWILPAAGSHGLYILEYREGHLDEIDKLLDNKEFVAVGEIGLNYLLDDEDGNEGKQRIIFEKQIQIAQKHNLPVVVHTKFSSTDTMAIIMKYPDVKFVMHCWEGNVADTKILLQHSKNIYFGYGSKTTLNNHKISGHRRETIKIVPKNRILLESDSPSQDTIPQTMIDKNKKINFPWYIRETAQFLAEHLKVDIDEFIDICNRNALEFYNLDESILDLVKEQ